MPALHLSALWAALALSAPDPHEAESLRLPLFTVEPQDELVGVRVSWLPGLVTAELSVTLDAPALQGAYGPVEARASLRWSGTVHHVFDGPIETPALALALLRRADLNPAWHRITAPPLTLTDDDLRTPLPDPMAVLVPPAVLTERIEPGDRLPISGREELGILFLDPAHAPLALAMVTDYVLLAPTPRDILRILAEGGAADFAALGHWLTSVGPPRDLFPPERRRDIFDAALALVQRLRGPPSLGDLHRLRSALLLLGWAAMPEDLERVLPLERRVRLLATSGALSYEEALRGEARIGVPYQEMHTLPSASEYLEIFDQALQDLRREALAELLYLSFDPLDFRDADDTLHESPLRDQARALLSPLDPVMVVPMLDAAGEREDTRRAMLEFYAHAGHAPAARPALAWLFEHPDRIPTLGRLVVRRLAVHVALPLFQAFANPQRPKQRPLARSMLLELPPEGRAVLARALAGVGIATTEDATIEQLLRTYELAERTRSEQQARSLIQRILHGPDNVVALSARVRAVQRLARNAPAHLSEHAEAIIDFLAHAATALRSDAPAESDEALATLEDLPLDPALHDRAVRTAALTRSDLAASRGDLDDALAVLAQHDPHLTHAQVRARYEQHVREAVLRDIDAGAFDSASARLHDLRERSGDEEALSALDERIFIARYWPAMALGGLFLLSLVGTGGFLAWRSFRSTWSQIRATRKLRRKLMRRLQRASDSVLIDGEDEEMEALLRELDALASTPTTEDEIASAVADLPATDPPPDGSGAAPILSLDVSDLGDLDDLDDGPGFDEDDFGVFGEDGKGGWDRPADDLDDRIGVEGEDDAATDGGGEAANVEPEMEPGGSAPEVRAAREHPSTGTREDAPAQDGLDVSALDASPARDASVDPDDPMDDDLDVGAGDGSAPHALTPPPDDPTDDELHTRERDRPAAQFHPADPDGPPGGDFGASERDASAGPGPTDASADDLEAFDDLADELARLVASDVASPAPATSSPPAGDEVDPDA